jgi:molybdopterin molybdotransferase
MLAYKQAVEKVFEQISILPKLTEEVNIVDSIGRVLAEDIISDVNLPPFDTSAMDGYTVRFHPEIRKWNVIGELSAGNFKDFEIDFDNTVSIMTGAKLPVGADTIIPVEDCVITESSIALQKDYLLKSGRHIRLQGEDLLKDSVAVSAGTLLKSSNISLAAACGKSTISVFSKLNIGVFATGDELVSIDSIPVNDQIRSSNLATIIALINEINMNSTDFGIIHDKMDLIEEKLIQALSSDIDILITTGGVSVGKYDFMQEALKSIGAEIQFWKVNIKPGKPFLFSTYKIRNKIVPIFSLPGNPLSCFVNFQLFVKQTLLMHYGIKNTNHFSAKLKSNVRKGDNRLHFIMAKSYFNHELGCFEVENAGSQSSGSMSTMSQSDCMFLFPENLTVLTIGDWVECIRI